MVTAHKEVGEPRQDGGQQQEEGSMDALDIQAEATDRAEAEDMRAASQEVAQVRRTSAAVWPEPMQGENPARLRETGKPPVGTARTMNTRPPPLCSRRSRGYEADRDIGKASTGQETGQGEPPQATWAGFLQWTLRRLVRLPAPARRDRRARISKFKTEVQQLRSQAPRFPGTQNAQSVC